LAAEGALRRLPRACHIMTDQFVRSFVRFRRRREYTGGFNGRLGADGYSKAFRSPQHVTISFMTRLGSPVSPVLKIVFSGKYRWSKTTEGGGQMSPGGWLHYDDAWIRGYSVVGEGAVLDMAVLPFPTVALWGPGLGPTYLNETAALNAVTHQLSSLVEHAERTERSTERLGKWTIAVAALTTLLIATTVVLVLVTIGWLHP
jgi:hypothetical protein